MEQSTKSKDSKLRKMLMDGCIAEWYTLKGYFIRVYPAFAIDKVRFSFVEKGTKGQGFDVYINTVSFMLLCEDIRSGRLLRQIEADNGQHPSAWSYRTGENGSKSVAIGKSRSGTPLVQGRDTMQKKNAQVPLDSYERLREMALLFGIVSGQVHANGYISELKAIFDKAKDSRRWHITDEDEPSAMQNVEATEPAAEAEASTDMPASAQAGHPAMQDEPKQRTDGAQTGCIYECLVLQAPKEQPNGLWLTVVNTQGRNLPLWASGRMPIMDILDGCAGQKRAVRLQIVVRGEGRDRKAWLVN